MSEHGLQNNRFELKYIIEENKARQVRDFVRAYLVPDPYANPNDEFSYHIHSLYLDSPGLDLCRATVQGHKNRIKLRIRFYDDVPDSPVFFEIKRRVSEVILKERAAVRRASVRRLLAGEPPTRDDLLDPDDDEGMLSLTRFLNIRDTLQADGKVFVSYKREAWVSAHDDSVRVTVDRQLATEKFREALQLDMFWTWKRPPISGQVLELKFTDRHPNWMRDMVESLNLYRTSMAKYVACTLSRPY